MVNTLKAVFLFFLLKAFLITREFLLRWPFSNLAAPPAVVLA